MPEAVTRRNFLAAFGAAAAAARGQTSVNKLGLDFFSLRSQEWTAFELLDFAARHGAEVAHFSEPRFLGSLDDAHLRKVKEHADRLNLAIEIGFGSICPTSTRFDKAAGSAPEQLRRMLHAAKIVGSPIVRCYLGSSQDRMTETPLEQHIENVIASCKAVRDDFLAAGVKIGVENHAGDLQALQLKDLVEEAGKDYVGALLDAGNAAWTLEDPHHTLEVLAPYAVTTGVRDSRIWLTDDGADVMWAPLGEGNVNIQRWYKRLAELRPDLPFSLEIIHVRSPRSFPFRKPEFWEPYRDVPAWVFNGFVELARTGEPYEAPQPPMSQTADPEGFKKWVADRERQDVERELRYCRDVLGLGRKF